MNAAHPEAASEGGDQRDEDCDCDGHHDKQRGASEQGRCCRLQDGVNDGDECVEKNHLG